MRRFIRLTLLASLFGAIAQAQPADVARAVWVDKDPARWPQILLEHNAHFKDEKILGGASGFLMRIPNGAVVAASAAHVVGNDTDLGSLDANIKSWVMAPRTMASKAVTLKKLALPADVARASDCLVMTVAPAAPWPVEVLVARERPAEVGETVYLLAVPYEEKKAQNVYKGTVTRVIEVGKGFGYEFTAEVQTRGFSGAPIIDSNGQVIGIHHGKFDAQPGGGKIEAAANAIAPILKSITAQPPPARPAAAATPAAAGTDAKPAAPAATDDSAEKAAKDLAMAKNYVALQKYDAARAKLQKVVDAYPNAPAAKEAKQLLQQIEGK